MLRRSILMAVAAAALALPGAASAGTLTADDACYGTGQNVLLAGTGFTPLFSLGLTGGSGEVSAFPDDDGAFDRVDFGLVDNPTFTPRQATITTHDLKDSANDTSLNLLTIRSGSNLPVHGKASQKVLWQFGDFPTGAAIYGHYRYGHNGPFHKVKDVRFGTASGPCGTLATKAKRVPVTKPKRGGGWYLQVDTKPKFSANTRPEYDVTFSVR